MKSQGLRLRVQLPANTQKGKNGKTLTVSDIWDPSSQNHLMYGAQIADHVTMSVSVATIPGERAPAVPCFNVQLKEEAEKAEKEAEEGKMAETNVAETGHKLNNTAGRRFGY